MRKQSRVSVLPGLDERAMIAMAFALGIALGLILAPWKDKR